MLYIRVDNLWQEEENLIAILEKGRCGTTCSIKDIKIKNEELNMTNQELGKIVNDITINKEEEKKKQEIEKEKLEKEKLEKENMKEKEKKETEEKTEEEIEDKYLCSDEDEEDLEKTKILNENIEIFEENKKKVKITSLISNFKFGIFNLDKGHLKEFDIEIFEENKKKVLNFDILYRKGYFKIEY
jgi:hypothetical protein